MALSWEDILFTLIKQHKMVTDQRVPDSSNALGTQRPEFGILEGLPESRRYSPDFS